MKCTFLFGAGAEGKGQLGLSSGAEFKKKIIRAQDVKEFAEHFNNGINLRNQRLLTANSTNVLYQTIMEMSDIEPDGKDEVFKKLCLNKEQIKTINKYIAYKNTSLKKKGTYSKIIQKFKKIYKNNIYDKIYNQEITDKGLEYFLNNAGIYSYVDAIFNYLRKPSLYENQISRIMLLYYGALKIIWDDMLSMTGKSSDEPIFSEDKMQNRQILMQQLDEMQNKIITDKTQEASETLYYQIVHDFVAKKNSDTEIKIVTTNYTQFAEKITGINENKKNGVSDIFYLHGKLGLFEDVDDKRIDRGDKFVDIDKIFPYLLVQSGIKPVINYYQLKELYQGAKALVDADVLFIIGYGMNSDDEHIINILKERLEQHKEDKIKHTVFYIYACNEKEFESEKIRIMNICGKDDKYKNQIEFCYTKDFGKFESYIKGRSVQ